MKLYQYWDTGEPPPEVAGWIDGFRSMNPDMQHRLFDRDRASWFIGKHLGARERRAFDACAVPAMQADYFRLCALAAKGGVYVDVDFESREPMRALVASAPGGLLALQDGELINGFMLAPSPANAFIGACLRLATLNVQAADIPNVYACTGPGVLSAVWGAIRPKVGHRLLAKMDNPLQESWGFAEVLRRAKSEIVVDDPLRAAFDALSLAPKAALRRWFVAREVAYKDSGRHWMNWQGSIYAERPKQRPE